ncbi:hypothetical protein T440DRAFT_411278, partial [Plenodomus tracheiphilus IPT5]
DEEERYLELASTVKSRRERVIRLGYRITQHERWITYDEISHRFSVVLTGVRQRPHRIYIKLCL